MPESDARSVSVCMPLCVRVTTVSIVIMFTVLYVPVFIFSQHTKYVICILMLCACVCILLNLTPSLPHPVKIPCLKSSVLSGPTSTFSVMRFLMKILSQISAKKRTSSRVLESALLLVVFK